MVVVMLIIVIYLNILNTLYIYIYIYIVANQYIQFRLLKNCLFQYGKITFYLVRHDFSHVECGVDPQNLFFDFLPP